MVGGISAINNQNTKSFKVTLNGVTNTITSSTYTVNGTTTFTNVPTDNTLIATATITDYYTSATKDTTLPTVAVTMDFLADGKGIAMGKVAEITDTFEVAWKTKLNKEVSINVPSINSLTINRTESKGAATVKFSNDNGALGYIGMADSANGGLRRWSHNAENNYLFLDTDNTKNYVVEQGVSSEWNYTKWSNGKSEAWRKIELGSVPLTTAMTTGLYSNNSYNARALNLPSGLFTEIHCAFSNIFSNGYTLTQVSSATPTQIVYRIWSQYSMTLDNGIVSLYVAGKWK